MVTRILAVVVLYGLSFSLSAQPVVSGPAPGFIYDTVSRSVRTVIGAPGASWMSSPAAADVDFASIGPNARTAVLWAPGGAVKAVPDLTAPDTFTVLDTAVSIPDYVAWMPDSSAVFVYSAPSRQLSRISALDGVPVVDLVADLSGLEGEMSFAAPANGRVFIGIRGGSGAGVYAVDSGNTTPAFIAAVAQPDAIAVLPGGDPVLWVADHGSQQILEIRNTGGAALITPFAELGEAPDTVGMAVSQDGQRLFVAGDGAMALRVYDIGSRTLSSQIDLDCPASFIQPLWATRFLYLLRSRTKSGDTVLVLSDRKQPSVYFVAPGE
jgi:sugar lactone lactonase YvrE